MTIVPPPAPTVREATPPVDIKDKTVSELAKELSTEALWRLHEIGHDPETKPAAAVSALTAIIDRAEGKVGILENNTINYTVVINQINRAMGKSKEVVDVTPTNSDADKSGLF